MHWFSGILLSKTKRARPCKSSGNCIVGNGEIDVVRGIGYGATKDSCISIIRHDIPEVLVGNRFSGIPRLKFHARVKFCRIFWTRG